MQNGRVTKKNRVAAPILAGVIAGILYLPVWVYLVQSWLENPYYGHGFLIPLVSGFIFWLRRHSLRITMTSLSEAIPLGGGLVLYGFAFILRMHTLAAFSLLVVLLGMVIYFCGRERAKSFAFPVLFLIFMIPMPFINGISYHLQTITTRSSAAIASLAGIPTVITGNQIEIPDATFLIGIPCAGMSSLISLLAVAAILAFLVDGAPWKKGVLFLSSIPIAVSANALRVAGILLVADRWGSEAAMRFFHAFSSLMLFALAIALLFLVVWLLRCHPKTLRELAHE